MARVGRVFVLAFVLTLMLPGAPAAAGPQWCEEDPVFLLNGNVVDITTGYPSDALPHVSWIAFIVEVPSNTLANAVIRIPGRVPTYAWVSPTLDAWIGLGGMPVQATVYVRASTGFDTATRVTGTTGAIVATVPGRSNSPLRLTFSALAP